MFVHLIDSKFNRSSILLPRARGFGDYLIWAHPPYTGQWDTQPVQIYTVLMAGIQPTICALSDKELFASQMEANLYKSHEDLIAQQATISGEPDI